MLATSVFPFTEKELSAALRREKDSWVRRRLIVLQVLLRGGTKAQAANAAKADHGFVARWLMHARIGGLDAVTTTLPRRLWPLPPEFISAVRAEIATTLERPLSGPLKLRLEGIDAALAGEPVEKAATHALVAPATFKKWIAHIRKHGVTALLAEREPRPRPAHLRVDGDAASLRARAATEKNSDLRKRLIALACMAEGLSLNDASVKSGISDATIITTIRRFQKDGIEAILPPKRRPTGRPPWLGPKELKAVARFARANPHATSEQFRTYIKTKLGVRYTLRGLKNMLKKRLGIVCATRPSVARGQVRD